MQLDLKALRTLLKEAPQEETVDSSDVNPYLLQKVLMPLFLLVSIRVVYLFPALHFQSVCVPCFEVGLL